MLTYMQVHLYYTLPVLGALAWALKPFHSTQDSLKYKFLSLMAFVTASLWDNYIVYHHAWSYCSSCVTVVIGYVPLEEYMFFIIMSLLTVSFTNLVMRWHLHSLCIKPNTPMIQTLLVRFIPIVGFLTIAYKAWYFAIPGKSLFYGCCILWYTCPVLALLWFGAGEYMLRRPLAVIISITLPTLFLCWVDTIAIAAGTWTISLRTSTGKMIVPHLPVEEFAFFTLINVILVFGTCAIDRAQAIIHLYKDNNPVENVRPIQQSFLQHIYGLIWAFFLPDQMLNNDTVQDLAVSWDILRKASKSFYTASAMFPGNIRQDLGVLYAFCRATDDFFDDETVPIKKRQHQLELMHQFIRDLFSQKTNASSAIDWEFYGNQLPASCLSAFKSFTRLRHVLKMDAIQELLDGYRWDLEHRPVITENDLRQYAACVASSVGEMCTRIILLHSDTEYSQAQVNWIIGRARDMGLVLQYTNIARDIVTDSQEAGRCYLPSVWLTETETLQIQKGNARGLDETRLLELSHKLIDEADRIMIIAKEGIAKLPNNCQGGVRAACYVYTTIGKTLKQCCSYPTRAHVKSARRAKIALLSVYHSKNKYF